MSGSYKKFGTLQEFRTLKNIMPLFYAPFYIDLKNGIIPIVNTK